MIEGIFESIKSARRSICLCCHLFAALELFTLFLQFLFPIYPLHLWQRFHWGLRGSDSPLPVPHSGRPSDCRGSGGYLFSWTLCTRTHLTARRSVFLHQITQEMACFRSFARNPLKCQGWAGEETVSCPTKPQDCEFCPILRSNRLHKPLPAKPFQKAERETY